MLAGNDRMSSRQREFHTKSLTEPCLKSPITRLLLYKSVRFIIFIMQIHISIGKTGWGIASSLCPSSNRLCLCWSCNACTVFVPTTLSFAGAMERQDLVPLSWTYQLVLILNVQHPWNKKVNFLFLVMPSKRWMLLLFLMKPFVSTLHSVGKVKIIIPASDLNIKQELC